MNRLQKKCLIATTGFHLLLILVLVFGSAFFVSRHKPDDTSILDVIPANLVDAAFSSGVKNAQAPAPTPPSPPQPPSPVQQPTPQPPPPKSVVPPPKPEPVKEKEPTPELEKPQKLSPDDLKPVEATKKPREPKIEVNKTLVTRNLPKPDNSSAEAEKAAAQQTKERANAFAKAMARISKNSSSATTVDMPGASSVAYASYKDALASIYYEAWTPPDDTSSDDAITKVRITIARDGRVISARIVGPSGDGRVDASVQRAIDRVTSVPPLPEGAKESERTVILNFNLKTKRQLA